LAHVSIFPGDDAPPYFHFLFKHVVEMIDDAPEHDLDSVSCQSMERSNLNDEQLFFRCLTRWKGSAEIEMVFQFLDFSFTCCLAHLFSDLIFSSDINSGCYGIIRIWLPVTGRNFSVYTVVRVLFITEGPCTDIMNSITQTNKSQKFLMM
jgi:hypothetical protein